MKDDVDDNHRLDHMRYTLMNAMTVSEDAKKIADDMKKEGLGLYMFSAEGREEWEKRFHDKVSRKED